MRFNNYHPPKSSFLSMEKDLSKILDKFLANERLKKLLYYTTRNPLEQPKLTEEQSVSLLGKNIKIVPKLFVDPEVLNYIVITFESYTPTETNPEFRNCNIEFTIVCHMDQVQLKDLKLRPYRIAAEIDTMLDGQRLTGIGPIQFRTAPKMVVINEEYVALRLTYLTVYGNEDRIKPLNPEDDLDR